MKSLLAAAAIALTAAASAVAAPIKMAVTDIEGLEALTQEFGAFEAELEAITGLEVELFPVASRTAAVEAMNADQVDFVLTGPAEYVVLKELADPVIVTDPPAPIRLPRFAASAAVAVSIVRSLTS